MNEKAWDEEGTRRVTVSFSVEIGADDDRTSADLAEAILAEYGHRGGDATMFLEPIKGAIGRAERFVASGGDTEVLLEGLPEGYEATLRLLANPVHAPKGEEAVLLQQEVADIAARALQEGLPESTKNGYDPAWVGAINVVLRERESDVRIRDLDDSLWERFIGPMVNAIEDGHFDPDLYEVEDESDGNH